MNEFFRKKTSMDLNFQDYKGEKIVLYGLGTETERLLPELKKCFDIIGLLDGFQENGVMYAEKILSLQEAVAAGVKMILVIARPGSCKVIANRIGNVCRGANIALFDVRGRDLLISAQTCYDFRNLDGGTRSELVDKIKKSDVVSFDLFDTLVMRRVLSYTDVLDLLAVELIKKGFVIPDFTKRRLASEKRLSWLRAPKLEEIYEDMLRELREDAGKDLDEGGSLTAQELAEWEWQIDFETMLPRGAVREVFQEAIAQGKRVVITSDCYYTEDRFQQILEKFKLTGCSYRLISCEQGTGKRQRLFDVLREREPGTRILHVGDDQTADMEEALAHGMDVFRVYSGMDLLESLGMLGVEKYVVSLSDRLKLGLFIAGLFHSPFWFEDDDRRLVLNSAYEIGYLLCAPMVADFVLWLQECVQKEGIDKILFGARDGYLLEKMYRRIGGVGAVYFLTSRNAAIRAGMEEAADIEYVDSMKYFGSETECMTARFGISMADSENEQKAQNRQRVILEKAREQRKNYKKYIEDVFPHVEGKFAFVDFVAKGTVQMYLQRLAEWNLKGFYFLQLEPEFMADKNLNIEGFYTDQEREDSVIFDQYYILETILTAPHPSVLEFDEEGKPVYAEETRSTENIECFMSVQQGIADYFEHYVRLLPAGEHITNKKLDEAFLALINRITILDESFLRLSIEDPFFNRVTVVREVLSGAPTP